MDSLNNQLLAPLSFRRLNISTDTLKQTYAKMAKSKKEIDESEYVLSLLEHMHDMKKCAMIRNEMKMMNNIKKGKKDKKNIVKSQYYFPNLNLDNFKKVSKDKNLTEAVSENELILTILNKFDIKLNKKLNKSKIKLTKATPFSFYTKKGTLNDNNLCNSNISYFNSSSYCYHTATTNNTNSNTRLNKKNKLVKSTNTNNYNTNRLNDKQFYIIANANVTQNDYMKIQDNIMNQMRGFKITPQFSHMQDTRNQRLKNILNMNSFTSNSNDINSNSNSNLNEYKSINTNRNNNINDESFINNIMSNTQNNNRTINSYKTKSNINNLKNYRFKSEYKKVLYNFPVINNKIYGYNVNKHNFPNIKEDLYNTYLDLKRYDKQKALELQRLKELEEKEEELKNAKKSSKNSSSQEEKSENSKINN